jgi:3-carboxy-cis,cis-muconate cycloisomerase
VPSSSGLFGPLYVPDAVRDAVADRAWLQAMLDAEAALAAAEARAGVIPADAAAAIRDACDAGRFDLDALGAAARGPGNPVPPLVRELSAAAGPYVHHGATSQDILDTAAMLVARRALELVDAELRGVADACARLAEEHRDTLLPARTLLQQALPTTFALKAAGWLVAVCEARSRLAGVGLAAQLGGAAGTLAALGPDGPAVLREFAAELGLDEPVVPWHTARGRVAELGAALAVAAGAVAKIGLDVALMAQTEVGEVAEGAPGGSSTLPHKRNPVAATLARACALRVNGAAGVLLAAMAQEHERAAGAWHAEWEALRDALALTGGAAAAARASLEDLRVDAARMRANLDLMDGLLLAERVAVLTGDRDAVERAASASGSFRDALLADPALRDAIGDVDTALDPAGYLGSANAFVDRALALYRR